MNICINPWYYMCIEANGNCYFCCSALLSDDYFIGNIIENSVEEIWNSEKAINFRNEILTGKSQHCKDSSCKNIYSKYNKYYKDIETKNFNSELPAVIQLNYDYTCDQRCIFCRDTINCLSSTDKLTYKMILNEKLLPIAKHFKLLMFNGVGEFFNSKETIEFIKKITELNPECKFELFTNGIHCTEENIKKLNIEDKVIEYHVSVNAATRETYNKIFRSDNFYNVMKNLKYLSSLLRSNKVEKITLGFVINSTNYKEMKKFVEIAKDLGAQISFTLTQVYHNTSYTEYEEEYAVFSPKHRNYNKFIDILNDPVFRSNGCNLDFNTDLKKISTMQCIKNHIEYYKYKLQKMLFH